MLNQHYTLYTNVQFASKPSNKVLVLTSKAIKGLVSDYLKDCLSICINQCNTWDWSKERSLRASLKFSWWKPTRGLFFFFCYCPSFGTPLHRTAVSLMAFQKGVKTCFFWRTQVRSIGNVMARWLPLQEYYVLFSLWDFIDFFFLLFVTEL